ncbi:hypothetical protein A2715_03935 [Candidatus Woesebacteria bacterium RIFCSPHIGHO2_01_FULL_39_32]|uniref:DUF304 domain-containing protein n=1 Tax=Candidatus Woesebacteria bacterium RIFCSPLOWO2_01_FULL_39_25 TaxID=1802521 RepID=A0A1F8BJY6_9BACT|nr:MAG: hypothetical protein A2715_03935 [Candidatus Woesebacteria bacterium RIFCSPHIGHO2_01_FULL_39_32]OGM35527.1 MAG: hypothetical protein A3F01_05025 [Candidatus Woesebacteria bacterium RIFCSPHIGHO2_12_FULL_38_11]OGM63979.1 MAG: hypothetical protein A2893_00525 [Candidatus Woesebacteria bacterium RIFCSPLOWO2_01_FULL_39_25]
MPDVFNSHKQVESVEQNSSKKQIEVKKPEKKFKTPEDMDRHELPGHNHNPFAAYCYYPDHVNFVNADPEEKVVLLLRRHPITNLSWISIAFLMVIAPSFFVLIAPFSLLPPGFQVVLTILWYLIVTAFILEEFLSWFFHVNIVTDERIIEVDFINLIYREVTDANIDQIQDVTVVVGGAPRTFFRYGNVVIQTASEIPKIEFEAIPNPDAVARVLRELRIEEEQEKLEGRVR